MMKVTEFYRALSERVPQELAASFDNDGLSCCPDGTRCVHRVLVALDATEAVVERAVSGKYDVLLTHHPLLFRPISALTEERTVPRKLLRLAAGGVSAVALHTRLDAVTGGVNDVLAELLGVKNTTPFGVAGEPLCGRIGELEHEMEAADFARLVCERLGTDAVVLAGEGPVRRIAVLGGEGADDIAAAKAAGADLYLSGRLGYHRMLDAPEDGLLLIEAGHFATEVPVLKLLSRMVHEIDPTITVDVISTPTLKLITV